MKFLQTIKTVSVTPPGAVVDNAAFVTATVDTRGFAQARFVVLLGALDIALTAFKLRESDDSGMVGAVDVPLADFSVSPLTLPSATDDNKVYGIILTLIGRKRYLDLTLTGGDGAVGTYATVFADLAGAAKHPNTAAQRGFAQEAIV